MVNKNSLVELGLKKIASEDSWVDYEEEIQSRLKDEYNDEIPPDKLDEAKRLSKNYGSGIGSLIGAAGGSYLGNKLDAPITGALTGATAGAAVGNKLSPGLNLEDASVRRDLNKRLHEKDLKKKIDNPFDKDEKYQKITSELESLSRDDFPKDKLTEEGRKMLERKHTSKFSKPLGSGLGVAGALGGGLLGHSLSKSKEFVPGGDIGVALGGLGGFVGGHLLGEGVSKLKKPKVPKDTSNINYEATKRAKELERRRREADINHRGGF